MKRRRQFLTYCLGTLLVIFLCWVFLASWVKRVITLKKSDVNSIEISETYYENYNITETSAGFYLYDKNLVPIYKDQEIVLDSEMEFNLLCVNACEIELKCTLIVLINDCYQEISIQTTDEDKVENPFLLPADDSIMLNIKYITYARQKYNNDIRFILLYYPTEVPSEKTELIAVADTVEIHQLVWDIESDYIDQYSLEVEYVQLAESNSLYGIWITLERQKSIPEFNYLLESMGENTVFFNAVGRSENYYYGIVFVDGVPQKIGDDYVFKWEQKNNTMVSIEIDLTSVVDKTIFAYMYEEESSIEDTYVTALYYVK